MSIWKELPQLGSTLLGLGDEGRGAAEQGRRTRLSRDPRTKATSPSGPVEVENTSIRG